MNLQKLFEMQAVLDADIIKRHPVQPGEDRLSKKILALLVELGECANEWRGFKFWSNHQRPRTEIFVDCKACQGTGDANYEMIQEDAEGIGQHEYIECVDCEGSGSEGPKNPLLEEYVDCLHFILSIGNDKGYNTRKMIHDIQKDEEWTNNFVTNVVMYKVEEIFTWQFREVMKFIESTKEKQFASACACYSAMFGSFLTLGRKLGLTWEQIEQAYCSKNKINFERQATGY